MLTFEQLEPALHKWARYFHNAHFEHWELINAVWLMGNIQILAHINFASQRIKWDMMDYMRENQRMRQRKRWEEKGKVFPSEMFVGTFDDDNTFEFQDKISEPDLDMDDLFGFLLKGCSQTFSQIIRLRFFEDYNFDEISEIIGSKSTTVYASYRNGMKILKKRLEEALGERHIRKRKIPSRRQDAGNSWEYHRTYFQCNFKKIMARRAELKKQRQAS